MPLVEAQLADPLAELISPATITWFAFGGIGLFFFYIWLKKQGII